MKQRLNNYQKAQAWEHLYKVVASDNEIVRRKLRNSRYIIAGLGIIISILAVFLTINIT